MIRPDDVTLNMLDAVTSELVDLGESEGDIVEQLAVGLQIEEGRGYTEALEIAEAYLAGAFDGPA